MNTELIKKDVEVINLNKQDLTIDISNDNTLKYWEVDFINERLDKISNQKHKTLFFFLWRTGVRISESLEVRVRDIDYTNYIITIRWLKKRKMQYRKIPMHPELRNILQYYTSNLKSDDRLFDFSRQRADQLAKAHFSGNCHRFRHSFAVNWLRNGADLYLLSKMLGHSSIKVTEVYLQVVPVDIGKELIKVKF